MIRQVRFGPFALEIDAERTKAVYSGLERVSQGCQCSGCRNFEEAVRQIPPQVKEFFACLGIDPHKPAEVYVNAQNPDGSLYYGGFYHLFGRLLAGDSAWKSGHAVFITDQFCAAFQEECGLVEPGFSDQVLQLEFLANLPWVLEETSDYPVRDGFTLG